MALRAEVETAAGSGAAPWESIELEIVRVVEAMNELRASPDYELHRLTERSPEFFVEVELAALQTEAEKLAGEIEELTGEPSFAVKGADGPS